LIRKPEIATRLIPNINSIYRTLEAQNLVYQFLRIFKQQMVLMIKGYQF